MATDVQKLSNDQLRNELLKLNASNVGPITSTTRTVYEKKLIQLRGVSSKASVSPVKPDDELRKELAKLGVTVGPITDTTRKMYQNKLKTLQSQSQKTPPTTKTPPTSKTTLTTKTPPTTKTQSTTKTLLTPTQSTKTNATKPASQVKLKSQFSVKPKTTSAAQTQDDDTSGKEEEFQMEPVMDWEQAPIPLKVKGGKGFGRRKSNEEDEEGGPPMLFFAHQSAHVVSDFRR